MYILFSGPIFVPLQTALGTIIQYRVLSTGRGRGKLTSTQACHLLPKRSAREILRELQRFFL